MSTFQVWAEGWAANGDGCHGAELVGEAEGETFAQAAESALHDAGWDMSYFDAERVSFWARRLFDNEADARKFLG